jgi:uncharacterized membrane protein YkoI
MRTLLQSLTLTAMLMTGSSAALADDDDVTLEELPAAVRETVQGEVKNGEILEIERDHDRDRTVYEVEFRLDSVKYELDVAEDGTLLRRHRD